MSNELDWFDPDLTHVLHNRAGIGLPDDLFTDEPDRYELAEDLLTGEPGRRGPLQAVVPATEAEAAEQFDCPVLRANMSGTACAKRSRATRRRKAQMSLRNSQCRRCEAGKARVKLLGDALDRRSRRGKGKACAKRQTEPASTPIKITVSEETGQTSFLLPGMGG